MYYPNPHSRQLVCALCTVADVALGFVGRGLAIFFTVTHAPTLWNATVQGDSLRFFKLPRASMRCPQVFGGGWVNKAVAQTKSAAAKEHI
jgi:hypothetical protein